MGHKSFVLAAVTVGSPPFCSDTTELRSWLLSGNGDVAKGEAVESLELKETVLSAGEMMSNVR